MKIIAHRGDMESYPENTILAFKKALEKGADSIELDVHLSKDKKLIIHHDYTLELPSGEKRVIPELASAYIKSLRDGEIPLLEEVFEDLGEKIGYEIELKGYTKEFLEVVMSAVQKYDLLTTIEFTSPHVYVLTYLKKKYPNVKVGMFVSSFPEWMDQKLGREISKNNALLGGVDVVHMPVSFLSKEYVDTLHNEGLLVHAANCDTPHDIRHAYKVMADQFSTSTLNLAIRSLKDL